MANTPSMKSSWTGLWDMQLRINGQAPLERLTSLNHPIKIQMSEDKQRAIITLKNTVDRSLVPCEDFVLYIRDTKIS